jgi:hypothetical protein
MLSKKYWRIAGAAMAGTAAMLVTSAAGAIDLTGKTGVNYAEETVVTTGELDVDDVKYYLIGRADVEESANIPPVEKNVLAEAGVALSLQTDRMLVVYTLTGLVFAEDLADIDLTVVDRANISAQLISGGKAEDSMALYSVTGGTFSSDQVLSLATNGFAISGRSGSISMKATNVNFAELFGVDSPTATKTTSFPGAISLKKALKVTTMPSDPMDTRSDRVATVGSEYKMFDHPMPTSADISTIDLGSVLVGYVANDPLTIDVNEELRRANATSGAVSDLNQLVNEPADADENSVTFIGDFSFASDVHIDESDDCDTEPTTLTRIIQRDSDEVPMDETTAVALATFATPAKFLCISVDSDGEDFDSIPDTAHYMAVTSLSGLSNAVFEPQGETYTLRRIRRDGTTVHIPYITTYSGYNQRIILSNRGSRNVVFRIQFRTEDAVMADPMKTEDMPLNAGQTLTMRSEDMVTLTGGSRTAATVMIEARPENIDVSSVTVNRESKDTDTVVHHSMSM